jgi:hypothetical protein
MEKFLRDCTVHIKDVRQPEVEVRYHMRAEDREKFISYVMLMSANATTMSFVQRLDLIYPATAQQRHQCRLTFDGPKRIGIEFMNKVEQFALVDENMKRKFVLADEIALTEEPIPPHLDDAFIKTRCIISLKHWRVEFVALYKLVTLNDAEIKAKRSIHFALPMKTLDAFVTYLRNPILVFTAFSIEYELLHSPAEHLDAAVNEFQLIDQIIFQQDVDAIRYRKLLIEVQTMINKEGRKHVDSIKEVAQQAITMTLDHYRRFYPFAGWYITPKADGTRGFLYINLAAYILESALIDLGEVPASDIGLTILDGECLPGDIFIVFDVLYLDGQSYFQLPFPQRHEQIARALERVGKLGLKWKFQTKPFACLPQVAINPSKYRETVKEMLTFAKVGLTYQVDGLMYYEATGSYHNGIVLKWKPSDSTTIDFLAMKVPDNILSTSIYRILPEHTLYVLYCTISATDRMKMVEPDIVRTQFGMINGNAVFPFPFVNSLYPNMHLFYSRQSDLDRTIIELAPIWVNERGEQVDGRASGAKVSWKFMRQRPDRQDLYRSGKYFGNYWKIAEQNFITFVYPLDMEMLHGDTSKYFVTDKSSMYEKPTKFNNSIKRMVFNEYFKGHSTLLDLAGGRGSDINNYPLIKNSVFVVEQDSGAIQEMVQRKYSMTPKEPSKTVPRLLILQQDLLRPADETLTRLDYLTAPLRDVDRGVSKRTLLNFDNVCCFFALHYFATNGSEIANFVNLVDCSLKRGGCLAFTVFDEARIKQLLSNGPWMVEHGGRLKYHIRMVDTQTPSPKIGVLMPFSDGNLVEEYLLDLGAVRKAFVARGYKIEIDQLFDSFFDTTQHGLLSAAAALDANDRVFVGLYRLILLRAPVK